ncbi:hypothetical protein CDL15_Pgr012551 [Punica granatum]|uniref:Uncharacterized protein n=1 Tax=Punica granatum TaxID=22663 RepID=A0A218XY55_PUNGR|nr:hypothetical protein CDL15_Pgr012551 [Punica granatum]
MCHPGLPLVGAARDPLWPRRRRPALEPPRANETRVAAAEPAGGCGGGGSVTKQCICSPTSHAGSFRCRQHHGEYVWGRRVVRS